ncbi:spore coat protein [Compostibacillus humi]|uniref:Spore coat protein n=1 Tax=Compostibacillus humi TaxID=1245525 RepID=A0A8J2ZPX3_9BACI|nr:CotY/CotZ family spore coat protein [Compostibacillus humi]GGH71428.1 spore coat protein [Compostibacillus humi]
MEAYWKDDGHDKGCHCHKGKNSRKSCHCHDRGKKHFEHCVEEVLEAIVEAQRKAKDDHCDTSCSHSIDDLLGKRKRSKKNTIPVILYCGCDPFKGTGVATYTCDSKKKRFKCVESFLFKVKDVKHGCAVLELLAFKSDFKHDKKKDHLCCPCCQIDHKPVHDLFGTGICITVDLSCFCAVSCLDAVHVK